MNTVSSISRIASIGYLRWWLISVWFALFSLLKFSVPAYFAHWYLNYHFDFQKWYAFTWKSIEERNGKKNHSPLNSEYIRETPPTRPTTTRHFPSLFGCLLLMNSRMCISHEQKKRITFFSSRKMLNEWATVRVCVCFSFNFLRRWFSLHIKFIMSMFFSSTNEKKHSYSSNERIYIYKLTRNNIQF